MRTLNKIFDLSMISNKKFVNYKVVYVFDYYNFDIKVVLSNLKFQKVMKFTMVHLFLEEAQITNRLHKSIFKGG
jgi:hypothetical protein